MWGFNSPRVEEELRQIPGFGGGIIAELTDRYSSKSELNEADFHELVNVDGMTPELAIHMLAVVCNPAEAADVLELHDGRLLGDESTAELRDQYPVDDEEVQAMQSTLREKGVGQGADIEKQLRTSIAAHQLPVGDYRGAFENHRDLIANEILECASGHPELEGEEGVPEDRVGAWPECGTAGLMEHYRARQMADVGAFIQVFLAREGPFVTKGDAIIAVKIVFGPVTPKSLPDERLADYIGCSTRYVSEFEVLQIDGRAVVLREE